MASITSAPGRAPAPSAVHAGDVDGAMVTARGVRKTYDTGGVRVEALRHVDLTVGRGEMVAIMGPSGCGKTTLLNCLSGLDAIDEGEIVIEGTPLSAMSDAARTDYRARRMGFVFQFYNLMPVLTAVENVELPLLVARDAARARRGGARSQALELVGRRRSGRARARRAVRRRAPARDDRPRAGERPGDRLGRRADRRPRQRERPGDRRAHAAAQPRARPQLPDRHPRHRRRPQHRPDRAHARRAGRRGADDWGSRMFARVTQLEIDVMRTSVEEAVGALRRGGAARAARAAGLPRAPWCSRTRQGFGTVVTLWDTRGATRGPDEASTRPTLAALRDALPRPARPRALRGPARRPARAPPRPRRRERALRRPRRDARRRAARRPRGRARRSSRCSRVRNRVLVRLGVRNVGRRRARIGADRRSGLMLGTTIIAASLATGDTMSHTIRAAAIEALGPDRRGGRPCRGAGGRRARELGAATGADYFPERVAARVRGALAGSGPGRRRDAGDRRAVAVAGARPAPQRAARDAVRRGPGRDGRVRRDPRGSTAARSPSRTWGRARSTSTPTPPTSSARAAGDRIVRPGGRAAVAARRSATSSSYDGAGTDESALLAAAPAAQALVGRPGARQPCAGLQPRRRDSRRGALRPGARARSARRRRRWASRRPPPSATRSTPPTRPAAPSWRSSPPSAPSRSPRASC